MRFMRHLTILAETKSGRKPTRGLEEQAEHGDNQSHSVAGLELANLAFFWPPLVLLLSFMINVLRAALAVGKSMMVAIELCARPKRNKIRLSDKF